MKKILYTIAILMIGILMGLGMGFLAGIFFAGQQVPTSTPTPAVTPVPTQKPASSDTTQNAEGFYGALHVEGTHLAAEDGTLVQLRGISTHGLGWFSGYVNDVMIAQARQEWGCNVFRLAMYTAEYNGYCTSDTSQKNNLKKIIDTGVQAAMEQETGIF